MRCSKAYTNILYLGDCINYLSADCPAIPISSGSPRFSLKISNTDQNEIGIGKIRIFTSFCDDVCFHRILIILMPEHHIECSQLKPIFQNLKKLQEIYRKIKVRQATRSDKAAKGYLCLCQPSSLHLLLFITRKYAIICVKRRPIVRRYIH